MSTRHAREEESLHARLAEETSEGRNVHFEARESAHSTAEYLADVQRAWKLADRDPETGWGVGRSIRYALIVASLRSRAAKTPSSSLVAEVNKGHWPLEQALTYARLIPDPARRANALMELGQPDEALASIQSIRDEYVRWDSFHALLPHLPEQSLPQALVIAHSFWWNWFRAETLAAVGSRLPGAEGRLVLEEALRAARAIADDRVRPLWLAATAKYLREPEKTQVLRETLIAMQALEGNYGDGFLRLAPYLPEPLLRHALRIAHTVADEDDRGRVLAALLRRLAEIGHPEEAVAVAQTMKSQRYSEELLAALAQAPVQSSSQQDAIDTQGSPEQPLNETLNTIAVIGDKDDCLDVLMALAPHLPQSEQHQIAQMALEAARTATDHRRRPRILRGVASFVPDTLLPEALGMVREWWFEEESDEVLTALAHRLIELGHLQDALALVDTLRHASDEALGSLATRLAELGHPEEALTVGGKIAGRYDSAKALTALALRLAELGDLKNCQAVVQMIETDYGRDDAFANLAYRLAELGRAEESLAMVELAKGELSRNETFATLASRLVDANCPGAALKALASITGWEDPGSILAALAPRLEPLWAEALEVAGALDTVPREHALAGLAPVLPDPLLQRALELVASLPEPFRYSPIEALAPRLTEPLLKEALRVALAAEDEDWRARALAGLVPHLPQRLLEEALTAARTFQSPTNLARLLAGIGQAPNLPDALRKEVLETMQTVEWDYRTACWLSSLVPYLRGRERAHMLEQALESAQTALYPPYRAEALAVLAPFLPEPRRTQILQEALAAVEEPLEIDDDADRVDALYVMASTLPESLIRPALKIAQTSQAYHVHRANALKALLTRMAQLGHPEEAVAAARAVENTSDNIFHPRCEVLKTLADRLMGLGYPKAGLIAIRAIDCRWHRAETLKTIIVRSAQLGYMEEALDAAQLELSEDHGQPSECPSAEALIALAPYLSKLSEPKRTQMLQQALGIACAIADTGQRSEALMILATHLPPSERGQIAKQVLQEILTTGDQCDRSRWLEKLCPRLTESACSTDVLEALQALESGDHRQVIGTMLPYLSEPMLRELLFTIPIGWDEWEQSRYAEALTAIAPRLPKTLLPTALVIAQAIDNRSLRATVLASLAQALASLPVRTLQPLWTATLHLLAARTRADLLSDLRSLVPAVVALRGTEAATEIANAIQDVVRWWP